MIQIDAEVFFQHPLHIYIFVLFEKRNNLFIIIIITVDTYQCNSCIFLEIFFLTSIWSPTAKKKEKESKYQIILDSWMMMMMMEFVSKQFCLSFTFILDQIFFLFIHSFILLIFPFNAFYFGIIMIMNIKWMNEWMNKYFVYRMV